MSTTGTFLQGYAPDALPPKKRQSRSKKKSQSNSASQSNCNAVPWFGNCLCVLFLVWQADLIRILPYPHGELGSATSLHTPLAGCGACRRLETTCTDPSYWVPQVAGGLRPTHYVDDSEMMRQHARWAPNCGLWPGVSVLHHRLHRVRASRGGQMDLLVM